MGEARRFPWTSCPTAVSPLQALVGMALSSRATAAGDHTDARMNCTHLFDLAGLAVAHAGAGRSVRQYDATVPDRRDGRTRAVLLRDGEPCLAWDISGRTIEGPPPFAGVALRRSFLAWATSALDEDTAEAAMVLRRACDISYGRGVDLDGIACADELRDLMLGTCHTFQPGTIETALRVTGSTRDFTAGF